MKNKQWIGLLVGFLFLTLSFSWSRANTGYSLNWFTVDGGGGTFSNGGSFSLGGTIGQPDAGSLSGNGFQLQSGFWHQCVAPAVPANPAVSATGNDLILTWDNDPAVATYNIYRETTPYFTPPAEGTFIGTTASAIYTDTVAIGDPALNYYYQILSQASCSAESVGSDELGEFDFMIVPGL